MAAAVRARGRPLPAVCTALRPRCPAPSAGGGARAVRERGGSRSPRGEESAGGASAGERSRRPGPGPEQGAAPPPAEPAESAAARTGHGGRGAGSRPGSLSVAPVMPRGGARSSGGARPAPSRRRLLPGPGWPRRGEAEASRGRRVLRGGCRSRAPCAGRAAAASPATSSSPSCSGGSSSRCPTSGSAASAAGRDSRKVTRNDLQGLGDALHPGQGGATAQQPPPH
ncbi:translation initiation factor IF-2-like [Cuculus canorus]|uniref:translation initiation factor IF-2-like n=1 Tax=Cuculus canorus TaxID=55661 RepID=UPI0023AA2D49|nr:translation initiation factor IF-2-like [Cuculus canorus]